MAKPRSDDVQRAFDEAKELLSETEARLLGRSRTRSGKERQAQAKSTAANRMQSGQQRQAEAKKEGRQRQAAANKAVRARAKRS
jgi:hypothetical protein